MTERPRSNSLDLGKATPERSQGAQSASQNRAVCSRPDALSVSRANRFLALAGPPQRHCRTVTTLIESAMPKLTAQRLVVRLNLSRKPLANTLPKADNER